MSNFIGAFYFITGIVQGVGFRPFIFNLANKLDIAGWVKNTSAGVEIIAEAPLEKITKFTENIISDLPPLARIDHMEVKYQSIVGFQDFKILDSEAIPGSFQPLSPDVSVCQDCLNELDDSLDRRYRYPFINCTNCGPRFTIIKDLPYDRQYTTMASYPMCHQCLQEYSDPTNRRFHAQPIACPTCGPKVWLEDYDGNKVFFEDSAILETQKLLLSGKILAVKGLGGFHLACNAFDEQAVKKLRDRKLRIDKPFAVMMTDIFEVRRHCKVNKHEEEILASREKPIVILERKKSSELGSSISPGQNSIGVMLPYTPLHHLLFTNKIRNESSKRIITALIMTSGNISEEPIAYTNLNARQQLQKLADYYLMHDRPIHIRTDDSVLRIVNLPDDNHYLQKEKQIYPIRRSRGYSPFPVRLPWETQPLLACGAELKNTFCVGRGNYAFLSHHIGDLQNYETYSSFESGISHFEKIFKIAPSLIIHDLHPDYLSTRYALERATSENIQSLGVQHHHAHIASCMVENNLPLDETVIGLAFDGTGFGGDGKIWGGEILLCSYNRYHRFSHLKYIPLLGGNRAIQEPWRIAFSWLKESGIDPFILFNNLSQKDKYPETQIAIEHQYKSLINSPLTSSMGRLFDAVAALLNIRSEVNYEGQAAIELEAIMDRYEKSEYPFFIHENISNEALIIDPTPMFQTILNDINLGICKEIMASRFQNTISRICIDICRRIYEEYGYKKVILSGGVWQNMKLLYKTIDLLEEEKFQVFYHHQVPTNDGGIALGQVAVASSGLQI